MNCKVYSVLRYWAYDGESGADFLLFWDRNDAKKAFDDLVAAETNDSWINGCEDLVLENDGEVFVAFEDGDYASTHTVIALEEKEVKGGRK